MSRALLQRALDWYEKDSSVGGLAVLMEEIEEELAKPDAEILFVWDVYGSDNKWLQTVTSPINYDAHNVQEYLVSQGYNRSIYVELRHSSILGQPPQPKLTPSDFWNAAPWNDDMDSIYINERVFIKYADNSIDIATMYSTGTMFRDNGRKVIKKYIAWLPLPAQEQK